MRKKLLLTAIILLIIPFSQAELLVAKYDHNAYVNSPFQTTRVCGCGVATDYFTLENTGDFDSSFTLSLETPVDWITLQQKQIYLMSGETTRIAVTLAAPCGSNEDTWYKIYATSQFGRFRAVDRTVTSQECESIRLSLTSYQNEVPPCTEARYSLELTNVATYQDTYDISASPEEIWLSQTQVTLMPGESTSIDASLKYSCDVSGDIPIDFYVTSQKNNRFHQQSTELTIIEDYAYTVNFISQQESICAEEETQQAVQVTNIAGTPNTYRASVDKPFASLNDDYFTLEPGESKTLIVSLSPGESYLGDQEYTITITEQSTGNAKTLTGQLNVRDCYEHEISVYPPNLQVCEGLTTVQVKLANRGEQTEAFTLDSQGDLFSQLEQTTVILRPNEQEVIPLTIGIPDRTEYFNIQVSAQQTPGERTVVDVPVSAVSNADCTELQPLSTVIEGFKDEFDVVPLIVEHRGIEAATYNLTYSGRVFELLEDEVYLAPGEQAVLHLKAKNLTDVPSGKYVEKLTMQSHRAIYRDDVKVVLKNRTWLGMLWAKLTRDDAGGIDWCGTLLVILSIIVALLILYLLLVIAGVFEPPSYTQGQSGFRSKLYLAVAVIAVILAVVASIGVSMPASYTENFTGSRPAELYHEWGQDSEYLIDLDDYFADPDMQALRYSDNQPEHFNIEYENSVAVINPQRGWSGVEQVVFTATDEEGLSTDSPIMTLKVIGLKPVSFTDYVKIYCTPINWLLVSLIALMLLALTSLANNADDEEGDKNNQDNDINELPPLKDADSPVDKTITKKALFVAKKGGKAYYPADSYHAKKRIPKSLVVKFASEKEAVKAGFKPSKTYFKK